MPNTVSWHDDSQTIMKVQYHHGASWEDFYAVFHVMGEMISQVSHLVYVIHIVEAIPGGSITTHVGSIMRATPDQIVGGVVIPAGSSVTNTLITMFVGIANKLYGKASNDNLGFAKDLDEAIAIAEQKLRLVNAATGQAQIS